MKTTGMKNIKIGLLTFPTGKAGKIPTSHLIAILQTLTQTLWVITGKEVYDHFKSDDRIQIISISHTAGVTLLQRILRYGYTQCRIAFQLVKLSKKVDMWIFFIGGNTLIIPMLMAKVLRKKIVLAFAGSSFKSSLSAQSIVTPMVKFLERVNRMLSTALILYSPNLIHEWHMERLRHKIHIAHEHFLDVEHFRSLRSFQEREMVFGYIGRWSEEKGMLNLLEALPLVSLNQTPWSFHIIGDGKLRDEINEQIIKKKLTAQVRVSNWIPHEDLPEVLNQLRLLIVPSYTEGLPNIVLEAMACGTPVVATAVGAIPDIIHDGKTGFIIHEHSPSCIAQTIERAILSPEIEDIIKNARNLIEEEFRFTSTVKRYEAILRVISGGEHESQSSVLNSS
jgi:glycosyltransferase involved in cell wall biosynthesis